MKFLKKQFVLSFFITTLFISGQCYSQSISVTGDWLLSIGVADLQGGAGTDLIDTYTSAVDEVMITVNGGQQNRTWAVHIHRQDSNWNSSLHLDAQAVHNRIIDGGRQEITTTDEYFFQSDNRQNVNNIEVQYWLWGVSVATLPPDTYTTTVYYTFVDL